MVKQIHSASPVPMSSNDGGDFGGMPVAGTSKSRPFVIRAKRTGRQMMKQVSVFVGINRWKQIRDEAARRKISIVKLVEGWIAPHIEKLPPANDP